MVTDDISQVIGNYCPDVVPNDVWKLVAPEVRAWVLACDPGHRRRALQLLHAAAHLGAWCVSEQVPVRSDTALRDTTIERFCAAAVRDGRHSTTTRSTIRSRLRCLAAHQNVPGNRPASPPLARSRVRPPYTASEIAAFLSLARNQGSRDKRSRLLALLYCGLGAGCAPADFRNLRGHDIGRLDDRCVVVNITSGRARQVPVLERYGPGLFDIANECGQNFLLGGRKPDRRSVTTSLLARVEGGADLPALEPGRLRSTWLATHLAAGTRMDILMTAAGLDTPTTIVDLVAHLTPVESDTARTSLRYAGSPR